MILLWQFLNNHTVWEWWADSVAASIWYHSAFVHWPLWYWVRVSRRSKISQKNQAYILSKVVRNIIFYKSCSHLVYKMYMQNHVMKRYHVRTNNLRSYVHFIGFVHGVRIDENIFMTHTPASLTKPIWAITRPFQNGTRPCHDYYRATREFKAYASQPTSLPDISKVTHTYIRITNKAVLSNRLDKNSDNAVNSQWIIHKYVYT